MMFVSSLLPALAVHTLLAGLALAPVGIRANHEHDIKPRHNRRNPISEPAGPAVNNSTIEKRADHTKARCTFYDVGETDDFHAPTLVA
jgi:hypothetical protein